MIWNEFVAKPENIRPASVPLRKTALISSRDTSICDSQNGSRRDEQHGRELAPVFRDNRYPPFPLCQDVPRLGARWRGGTSHGVCQIAPGYRGHYGGKTGGDQVNADEEADYPDRGSWPAENDDHGQSQIRETAE